MPVKLSRANITPLTFTVLVFNVQKNIEIVLYNKKYLIINSIIFLAFINEDISTNVSQLFAC